MAWIIAGSVLGMLLVALFLRMAWVAGYRSAFGEFHERYMLPTFKRQVKLERDMSRLAVQDGETAVRTNVRLLAKNRILTRKCIHLARRYGAAAARLRWKPSRLSLIASAAATALQVMDETKKDIERTKKRMKR